MILRTRLLVFGALVPTLLMGVGFIATGILVDQQLLDATDRALLTQAAVESVSLFDGPDGQPHLHLARSPLTGMVQGFSRCSLRVATRRGGSTFGRSRRCRG